MIDEIKNKFGIYILKLGFDWLNILGSFQCLYLIYCRNFVDYRIKIKIKKEEVNF